MTLEIHTQDFPIRRKKKKGMCLRHTGKTREPQIKNFKSNLLFGIYQSSHHGKESFFILLSYNSIPVLPGFYFDSPKLGGGKVTTIF